MLFSQSTSIVLSEQLKPSCNHPKNASTQIQHLGNLVVFYVTSQGNSDAMLRLTKTLNLTLNDCISLDYLTWTEYINEHQIKSEI